MRKLSKPCTAQCNWNFYTLFLLAEPKYVRCMRLGAILEELSHDSINRLLLRKRYCPEDHRICDKQENKTKNDYFIEMMHEVKRWGIKPAWVTGDCWYSSLPNLKFLRNEGVGFLFGIGHWRIESFHRVIKQVCNIERFHVRNGEAIRNHIFFALRAFSKLQTMRIDGLIHNLYEVSRQLFIPVIQEFILKNHVGHYFSTDAENGDSVNA